MKVETRTVLGDFYAHYAVPALGLVIIRARRIGSEAPREIPTRYLERL